MRTLIPYLGIALAVAIGIALAPWIGWILFWAAAFLVFCFACRFVRDTYRRVTARLRAWYDRTLV